MAGTIKAPHNAGPFFFCVSMESGLDGRNNYYFYDVHGCPSVVSMESGLDGRNNRSSFSRPHERGTWSQWSPA